MLDNIKTKNISDEVRRLLRKMLATDQCTAAGIARVLEMDRRTLHRRLEREDVGFQTLLDEVRFETARRMLRDTGVPLLEISRALGYSEPSAFTRAFRRWSGRSPMEWRVSSGA